MPGLYRGKSPLTNVDPEALVVHCSAARFQPHFEEFLVEGLNLKNYSLIAIPGGVQALMLVDYMPKFAWASWRWTKFLLDADRPPRLVLLAHEDCRWYRHLWPQEPLKGRILGDLARARGSLQDRFPRSPIELYYARLDAQGHVVFETA